MPDPTDAKRLNPADFSSEYTLDFPRILAALGVSLAVTTYQSGHLILIRADGDSINTHFAGFAKPMGLAVDATKLVLGTQRELREYWNVPALAARIDALPRPDAIYALRNVHVTGDIDVHEIALGDAGTWYVNTAFSCLCLAAPEHSFTPHWRPPFVSGFAPEDRCHLNGLALKDGAPRWMTALGQGDAPQAWRANKRSGGVLLDYPGGEVIAGALSMPHSPRWYRSRLWLLESGKGALATVDPNNGAVTEVARVPGFTRGMDFAGPIAFVGLSTLREKHAFADIPITEGDSARACGVWAIHLGTGKVAGFLRFRGRVEELFAVSVIPNCRTPALVDADSALLDHTYVLPDAALAELRFSAPLQDAER